MGFLAANFVACSAILLALPTIIGCSLLAPSDDALMGERREPSNVPPEPPITDGLVFWLDGASQVEAVEGGSANPKIERWRDFSGNEHDAVQGDTGLQPAWIDDASSQRQVPLFSSGAKLSIADIPLTAEGFTLLLQARPVAWAATDTPLAFGTEGPRLVGEDDLDMSLRLTEVDMNANDIDAAFAWVPGRATLTVARLDADGVASARVDSHAVMETRTVTPPTGSFEVVLGNAAATIAVVGLYARALDLEEIEELEQFVSHRWACCTP